MNESRPITFGEAARKRGLQQARALLPETPPVQETLLSPPSKPSKPPVAEKIPHCSCCKRAQERTQVLLGTGKGILLCDRCIDICNTILSEDGITTDAKPAPRTHAISVAINRRRYCCSLCGKEQEQVALLIAMLNNIFICNFCVGDCNATIAHARLDTPTKPPEAE